ncbi:HdeD family acid-resistance protein [Fibrisoma montanum]|nr:DUF308 domain-containing protein [Fibrisoma montanum]
MDNLNPTQRWWLMMARGVLYILIGAVMFVFANAYTAQSGAILGTLAALAGACQLAFSFTNQRKDKNHIWGVLHGLADVAFGVAIFLFSDGTVKGFVDVLGFWAMMYAFLQAVQAMYTFMAARGAGVVSGTSVVHFANILVAGGLAFSLLLRPAGFDNSLGYVGIFPILLGVLIIVLTQQMRAQAERSYRNADR